MTILAPGLHVGSGNRCGHRPDTPNFLVQRHTEKLPLVLQRAYERVEDLYPRIATLAELDTLNPCRRKRSERRESHVQVLKALIKYLDLVTMTVCIPSDDGQIGMTLHRLWRETSISWSRFKRAISDFRRAGLMTISQPRTTTRAGDVRGLVAIKALSVKIFQAIRLNLALGRERRKASRRQQARAARAGKTQRAYYRRPGCVKPAAQSVDTAHDDITRAKNFAHGVAMRNARGRPPQ